MTQQPTVSIIVNNYNYGRFVGQAIESALAQTYPKVEVIVVDDGSTDDSREVIAGYGDRVIPVLKANGGQASAFNAGFKVSTGDLILFLDSDDMLEPNAIEAVVGEWQDGLSRIFFLQQVIDAKGEPCGVVGGTIAPSPMLGTFVSGSATSANVFSRAALEKVMPVPEEDWKINADYYLNAASSLFGEARRLARPLVKYRIHGNNNIMGADLQYSMRKRLHNDRSLYDALFRLTNGKVGSLDDWLGRSPQHWVSRIRWLRESPQDYPWPDTLPGLTARAVRAAWRQPERKLHQRLAFTIYAFAYGLLPRKLTRLLGKAVPMARIVAIKEQREEVKILARAAEQG